MDVLLVGIGGAAGSVARYKLGKLITQRSRFTFPAGTFIVNITGAILLGLVISAGTGGSIYLLLADGFLGAYTTFSTFIYEGFGLFKDKKINALVYIAGSLVLGVIGYFIGFEFGGLFFR